MSAFSPDLERRGTDTTQVGEEAQDEMGAKPWQCGDTRHYTIPKNENDWKECNALVEKYDNGMCGAWKDAVDKLLVFAGLFSGVVTGFTTQSYQWLGEHSADSSARLLSFIATQFANSTNPLPPSLAIPEFTVTQSQIRINVLWFLSLTISLTTVLLGILCLQWLREFQRDAPLPHIDAVALRQMRYEGLIKWHVPGILSILPVLLQISLVLFFIGLLDLLWSLNTLVAVCVSVAVGMVMLFLIATTALPALQPTLTGNRHLRVPPCPYKSPQSLLFYRAGQFCYYPLRRFYYCLVRGYFRLTRGRLGHFPNRSLLHPDKDKRVSSWLIYDIRWRNLRDDEDDMRWRSLRDVEDGMRWRSLRDAEDDMGWHSLRDAEDISWGKYRRLRHSDDVVHGLHWINETFAHRVEAIVPVYQYLADLDIPAAKDMISQLYLTESPLRHVTSRVFDYGTFNTMIDDLHSPTEMQKRDIIAVFYLKMYQERLPVLKAGYVETVIRILNTQDAPKAFHRWLSEILQDLTLKPLLAPLNTNEIIIQTLLCVKCCLARNKLLIKDVANAWTLLRQLLTLPSPPPPHPRHSTPPIDSEPPKLALGLNLDHIKLAGGLFEALEAWLSGGEETDRRQRVKACRGEMIRLFSSSIDIVALNAEYPVQMAKAAGLVRALGVHISKLGGAAAVLDGTRCGFDLPGQKISEVGEWDSLVSRFKGIEGGYK